MTDNKPEVVGYRHQSGYLANSTTHPEYYDALVLLSDYEALQAECEKLRKDAGRYVPLYEAIQRAAAELPEVWEIHLCVVRDSGSVDLIGPDGTEDFCTDNERLDYTVIDALEFAISAAMQEGN